MSSTKEVEQAHGTDMIFRLEDRPPVGQAALAALQHLFVPPVFPLKSSMKMQINYQNSKTGYERLSMNWKDMD